MIAFRPTPAQGAAALSAALAIVAYPILTEWALARFEARGVALVALVVAGLTLALRWRFESQARSRLLAQYAGIAVLLATAIATNAALPLLLLPALVNLALAFLCGATLRDQQSLFERLGRAVEPLMPEFTRSYCHKVTAVWTAFFALSALLVAVLALASPDHWWRIYTSELYFTSIGILTIAEFPVRKAWFRYYDERSPVDRVLARWLPPENTAQGRVSLAYIQMMRAQGHRRGR